MKQIGMEQDKLHIIITGDQGEGRSFAISKKTAQRTMIIGVSVAVLLVIGTITGLALINKTVHLSSHNKQLDAQLAETMSALDKAQADRFQLITDYEDDISRLESDLEGSINRLDEKSRGIQKVMDHIGVEVKVEEDPDHSGGPYIPLDERYGEKLIIKADRYLEVLNKIPLGRPVPGRISSKFGRRTDPMKKKKAFHTGIDFRGHTGDNIMATADGVVKVSSSNNVLGKYIILAHNNGYESIFAHMHKRLVKKGAIVQRGQVIGHIGNTGRSTGSHLHYGIRYNNKSIDPMKYLQVAGLSISLTNQ